MINSIDTKKACDQISRENHDSQDTGTPKFIAALFTISKTWKPPKRPLTDEWIRRCATI